MYYSERITCVSATQTKPKFPLPRVNSRPMSFSEKCNEFLLRLNYSLLNILNLPFSFRFGENFDNIEFQLSLWWCDDVTCKKWRPFMNEGRDRLFKVGWKVYSMITNRFLHFLKSSSSGSSSPLSSWRGALHERPEQSISDIDRRSAQS